MNLNLAQQYIGGTWRPGSGQKVLLDSNPYTRQVIAEFPVATASDVDEAYRAAHAAQQRWSAVNAYKKRAVFERVLAAVQENTGWITELIVDELGGTRAKAEAEIELTLDTLREAATIPLRVEGRILPSPLDDKENYVYRVPVGVVGVITPFNIPFFLSMKCVAAALAAGNGVVVKPHEDAPITGGTLIAKLFEEAGLPAGLLNVVVTDVPTIGDTFVSHPVPSLISFTGSTQAGRHVAEVAGRHLKKVVLELGGNSALIVLDDADVCYAADAAMVSRFTHQGQSCMSANRILLHRSVFAEFRDKFVASVRSLKVGDPADPTTAIGPLINDRQAQSLNATVDEAVARGATVLVRGGVDGSLLDPVVLTGIRPDMPILRRELFGPVVLLIPFDDDDHAVALANDTDLGLSGAVFSGDVERGLAVAKRIHTGMIHVNDVTIHDEPIVPFGGVKQSGVGRLNGQSSVDELTTTKWISVHRGRRVFE